jgi:hypothetical protein
MGIASVELAAQRQLTKAFIAADSLEVTLIRTPREADGAGGVEVGTPASLAPQVMRLIPLQDGHEPRQTADGEQAVPRYMLMGTHDADMARWDEFELDSGWYQLVFLNQNQQYEKKAEVVYRGR